MLLLRGLLSRWRLEQFKEAEGLEVQIVRLRKEVESKRELGTIRAMMVLGETWRRLNRHEEAAKMFEEVLTLDTEEAGGRRWLTLQATEQLGWTYQQLKRVEDAVPHQTQAHKMIDDTCWDGFLIQGRRVRKHTLCRCCIIGTSRRDIQLRSHIPWMSSISLWLINIPTCSG